MSVKFSEALELLRSHKLRRASWLPGIYMETRGIQDQYFALVIGDKVCKHELTILDIFADDWEELEPVFRAGQTYVGSRGERSRVLDLDGDLFLIPLQGKTRRARPIEEINIKYWRREPCDVKQQSSRPVGW